MIKNLAKKLFKKFGVEVTRIQTGPQPPPPGHNTLSKPMDQNHYLSTLSTEPLNAELHLRYAIEASQSGRPYLAFAELKTAEYLGADRKYIEKYLDSFRNALPEQKSMNHNQFFRFATLSSEIFERGGRTGLSILDVGGGEGQLASFLPDLAYCLAEPAINGISGIRLPFPDRSFDYVVSCHVLEHIPIGERETFLDQLLAKSRRGVILLNPFEVENTYVTERLNLILDITGAHWAKEHLECTLPKIQDLRDYAAARNLPIDIKPNGTLTTSFAFLFVDYFARKSASDDEWKKLNAFVNENYTDILNSADYPNAYLVYLASPDARGNRYSKGQPRPMPSGTPPLSDRT